MRQSSLSLTVVSRDGLKGIPLAALDHPTPRCRLSRSSRYGRSSLTRLLRNGSRSCESSVSTYHPKKKQSYAPSLTSTSTDAELTALDPQVQTALATKGDVSTMPGACVEGKDIQRLLPGRWLNDEITTFYGVLINKRWKDVEAQPDGKEQMKKRGLLRCHCFSSFFMNNLNDKGHAGVKKWTKKVRRGCK